MTEDRMALVELLQKSGEADFLRGVAESVLQILMETDVEGLIGAGRHERSGDRLNYRNGYRDRTLDTRLGPLSLRIPKLRQGSYFPPFLEPRNRRLDLHHLDRRDRLQIVNAADIIYERVLRARGGI
jgi:putative transposase